MRKTDVTALGQCDILKISDNEIQWLTGEEDYTKGVEWINRSYSIPLILVSMGKEGSRAYYKGEMVEAAPVLQENTRKGALRVMPSKEEILKNIPGNVKTIDTKGK